MLPPPKKAMTTEATATEATTTEVTTVKGITTSLLPQARQWAHYEIAASMHPADEVGGDYHDVIADPGGDGVWIAIGDVSGHGLKAGIIALMVESIVLALIRSRPDIPPTELVAALNDTLHENLRKRMHADDFVTFAILRCHDDGLVTMTGAHEDVLVWRQATGHCEKVALKGVWLGLRADIGGLLSSASVQLGEGDTLLLHTDGITESVGPDGQPFGPDRLVALFEEQGENPPEAIRRAVLGGAPTKPDDDMTVVIARYRSRGPSPEPIRTSAPVHR
jgi:serine phosphatase RsbU (regulator of sigma subunit)